MFHYVAKNCVIRGSPPPTNAPKPSSFTPGISLFRRSDESRSVPSLYRCCHPRDEAGVTKRHVGSKLTHRNYTLFSNRHVGFKPTNQNDTSFSKQHTPNRRVVSKTTRRTFCLLLHSGPFLNV